MLLKGYKVLEGSCSPGYQGSASGSSDSLLVLSKAISSSASAAGQGVTGGKLLAQGVTGGKSRPDFDSFPLGEMKVKGRLTR